MDFPETFSFTCISETTVAILGKGSARLSKTEKKDRCFFSQVVYVFTTTGFWIAALVFFVSKQTTNKVKSPEQSRDLNQECYWLDFF